MARKAGSHAQTTGPRVRDAARRLIARHGFAAVSMRQIAGEVGVQAGALYSYTADKQALLFDLMQSHMEDLLAAWERVEPGDGPQERLQAFTQFHIDYHLDRPEDVFISYMELRNLDPENFARIEGLRRRYEAVLEEILHDGQTRGDFHVPDVRLATMGLIAMLTGVTTWYRADGRLSRERVAHIYDTMVRRLVKA